MEVIYQNTRSMVCRLTFESRRYCVKYYTVHSNEMDDLLRSREASLKRLARSVDPPTSLKSILGQFNHIYTVMPDYGSDMYDVLYKLRLRLRFLPNCEYVFLEMFYAIEDFNALFHRPHGDIKLENYLYNQGNPVLCDFEIGPTSVVYMSINQHHGRETTIRDDLESFGYMLVALYSGETQSFWQDKSGEAVLSDKIKYMTTTGDNQPANDLIRLYLKRVHNYPQSREELIAIIKQILEITNLI
jgi:serine/threonine protein kinase